MDTLTPLKLNLARIIEDTFRYYGNDPVNMKTVLLFNREQGQFVMMHVGHENGRYLTQVVAHLELRGDQILVHDDNAGMNFIAPNLIAQGVPRDKITVVAHPDWHIEKA